MRTASLILVFLFLAGCGATQQNARQANGFENMGYVRQAACYGCLKPTSEAEATYLRNMRDTLNALLDDKK